MIDGLIRWSLRHRPIVLALAAAFLIWGAWTATRIPLDVLPDLTAPTVTILAEAPGMDPLEIESLVTFPIESALNGAAGVPRVRSATAVGVAVLWVEFDWGQDINRARQTVTEKLTLVSGSLPPNVEPPFLAPVSSIMGEVLFIDLESDRHSPLEPGPSRKPLSDVGFWPCLASRKSSPREANRSSTKWSSIRYALRHTR
jgi:Cu/Ag efflux pump CusA